MMLDNRSEDHVGAVKSMRGEYHKLMTATF